MKYFVLSILALLVFCAASQAATLRIEGPNEITAGERLMFNLYLQDSAPLADIDQWSVGLALSPDNQNVYLAGADLTVADCPDYLLYGDSYEYTYHQMSPHQLIISDLTMAGSGVAGGADKLLAQIYIETALDAEDGIYNLLLFGVGSWTLFADSQGVVNGENITLVPSSGSFKVISVPLPSALWLFASGISVIFGFARARILGKES